MSGTQTEFPLPFEVPENLRERLNDGKQMAVQHQFNQDIGIAGKTSFPQLVAQNSNSVRPWC